jgi:hypothetical protein
MLNVVKPITSKKAVSFEVPDALLE